MAAARRRRDPSAVAAFDAFDGRYLSLTSFRKDGSAAATPVWFVRENGRLLVETGTSTWKVKRIRRNPEVLVAPCTASGRPRGEAVSGRAELLSAEETQRVRQLLSRKYRYDLVVLRPIRWITRVVTRHAEKPIGIAITPRDGA